MRNTYVMAAVVALGLVAPVAFYAGQYVSQSYESVAGTALNQGDGGNGLTGLPGGGGPSTDAFSWGLHKPGGTYGEIGVQGRVDKLDDMDTLAGRQEEEIMDAKGHEAWIDIAAYIVPPDWDGLASGERIHTPLADEGEPGISKAYDKATPLIYVAVSREGLDDGAETRAVDEYLKIKAVLEPGMPTVISGLDETDQTVGGRIWVNFSLNFRKIEMTVSEQSAYSTYIELPKSWLPPSLTVDKSSPLLFMAMGANPGVREIDGNATFEMSVGMVYDTAVDIIFEPFTHLEDLSFTYGHMEDVSLTYMFMEDISFTFEHLEEISFTYGQVREGGWDLTENKGG